MHKSLKQLAVGGVASLFSLGALAQAEANYIFIDNFDNGVIEDSDEIEGFWKEVIHVARSQTGFATEEDGRAMLAVRPDEGTSDNNIRTGLQSVDSHEMFNFFDQPLRISANELELQSDGSDARLNVGLANEEERVFWSVEDAIYAQFWVDGHVNLWAKRESSNDHGNQLVDIEPTGADPVAFDLDLDAEDFSFVVHYDDGSSSSVYTGQHGLSSPWDFTSMLEVHQNPVGTDATGYVGQFAVIPEPGSLALLGLGAGAMFLRRRR